MLLTRIHVALALFLAGSLAAVAAGFSNFRPLTEAPEAQEPRGAPAEAKKDGDVVGTLAGDWRLTLPAGFQYPVVVRPRGENRYSVEKAVRFSGVYELRKDRLVLVEPADRGEKDFEWEVRGANELILVAQPEVRKIGSNYLGATLRRGAEGKDPVPGRPLETGAARPMPAVRGKPSEKLTDLVKPQTAVGDFTAEEMLAARALERIKSEYRLKREPAYQGRVQYCLVLLGREARTRLWLASDGKTMYIDKNGDGDLTQPGEAIPFTPDKDGGFASFMTNQFPEHVGDGAHTGLHFAVRQRDWQQNRGGYWAIRATVSGQYPMYAFAHKFPQQPDDAPVIHLGGPLRLGLYDLEGGRLLRGRPVELNAYVGCQYPGVEKAYVDVDKWQRTDVHPQAEIRLLGPGPDVEPIVLRVPLTQRC